MGDLRERIELRGSAFERGRQHAASRPALADRVRSAVRDRLEALGPTLVRPWVQDFLQAQTRFLQAHDRAGFDESLGIAEGYGIAHDDLLAYLHGNILSERAEPGAPASDGCTAWAHRDADGGAFVVKNRDYRGVHGALQQVFRHDDPAWGGRALLCVGSLGSPGAFSSGINSDGLTVADTQIGTRDHGVGWLRYFLMTALLRECADVAEALELIAAVPHAGGGSLILGDRTGAVAAVELGHRQVPHFEQHAVWTARTNHDLSPRLAADMLLPRDDLSDSTFSRLDQVREALTQAAGRMDCVQARALMTSHRRVGAICRHAAGDALARTLSCAIYQTASATLHLSHGNPCEAQWSRYSLSDGEPGSRGEHP